MVKTMVNRRRLTQNDLLWMNIPRRFWGVRFNKISNFDSDGQHNLRLLVRNYFNSFQSVVQKGIGLILWGDNGIGKTSASCVIAKEARRRGSSVLFLTMFEYLDSIISKIEFSYNKTIVERAKEVDILVLDDFGKEFRDKKKWTDIQIEELIRCRNSNLGITIITMNMPMDEFIANSSNSLLDIMKESMFPFEVIGENLRSQNSLETGKLLFFS
jgi:DNA replication protein DnaC